MDHPAAPKTDAAIVDEALGKLAKAYQIFHDDIREILKDAVGSQWRIIESAPQDEPVILAVYCGPTAGWLVGEGIYDLEFRGWRWVNLDPSDSREVVQRLSPEFWMPLPAPPTNPEERKTAGA